MSTVHKDNKEKKDAGFVSMDFLLKLEQWYERNSKKINYITTAALLIAVVCVYLGVFWMPKRQLKAEQAVFKAEQYFAQDSLRLALNGDGVYDGLLDVASTYGCTKTGNRAKYEIGICYLQLGEYENAIKYLKKFKGKDMLVSVQALGSIGDAYMELNNMDKALSYYKKAIKLHPNELLTPRYLYRAAFVCEMQSQWKAAAQYYETLQHSYPNSLEANDVEKRIAYVKAKQDK